MKKKIFSTLVFVTLTLAVYAQGIIEWAKDIGTNNNEYPTKICSDNVGNSYIAGAYSQTLIICNDTLAVVMQPSSANQTQNLFISKLDSLGNCIWTKTGLSHVPMTSGAIGPQINDISYYNGKIYCVGVFTDSMIFDHDTLFNPSCVDFCTSSFILCIDASTGIINWSKCFDGSTAYSAARTILAYSNGLFVSGGYCNSLNVDTVHLNPPHPTNYNGYVLKFNNYGNCIWGKNIGINHLSDISDMAFDGDKNLYLAGNYSDTMFFPNDTFTNNLPIYQSRTFFAKYDTSGNFI